ncbi:MAG: DUF4760 domain-containing protein [Actinomycetota bacterium]
METVAPSPGPPLWTWETWANISQVVTATATVVALIGIALAWAAATRSRHAALMADISKRWDEDLLAEARQLAAPFVDDPWLLRSYLSVLVEMGSEKRFVLERIPNFFEDLAVLLRAHAISFAIVEDTFGLGLVKTWDQWKPAVWYRRTQENDATVYEHFEELAERMRAALT